MGCKNSKPRSPNVSSIAPTEIVRGNILVQSDMIVIEKCLWTTEYGDIPAILKRPKLHPTPVAVKLLKQEAETTRFLNHDRTVRIYGFVSFQDGQVGIVMEEMSMSLEYYLRSFENTTLSTEYLLKISIQTADSLNHSVKRGVLNNDVATRNVLIDIFDGSIVAKVCDLGNAKTGTIKKEKYADDVKAFGYILLDLLKHSTGADRETDNRNVLNHVQDLAQRCVSSTHSNRPSIQQCFEELSQFYQSHFGRAYASCNCVQACLKAVYGREPVSLVIIGMRGSDVVDVLARAAIGEISTVDTVLGSFRQVQSKNVFTNCVAIERNTAVASFKLAQSFPNIKGIIVYLHANISDADFQVMARWLDLLRNSKLNPKIQLLQRDTPTALRRLPLLTKLSIRQPQPLNMIKIAKLSDENDAALWDSFSWLVQ